MKLGYCCLYKSADDNEKEESFFNPKTTTITFLSKLSAAEQFEKLEQIIIHNLTGMKRLVEYTLTLPSELHLLRFSSTILPLFTSEVASHFYHNIRIKNFIIDSLFDIGNLCRQYKLRVGFHPDQFCVLMSKNSKAMENGKKEFLYHLTMVEMMGYNGWHDHGTFINIHAGTKELPVRELLTTVKNLPKNAKNFLTLENDEFSHGINELIEIKDEIALVLDVHHHWIKTGEYVSPDDRRVKDIIDSWQGVRPLMHYSLSREDVLVGHSKTEKPNLEQLLKAGFKKALLRKHSDYYWNQAVNSWLFTFTPYFDIECESKAKNLASAQLYQEFTGIF